MIDPASFGDVMQKRREIKLGAVGDLRHDLGGERQFLAKPSRFDRAEFADGANEMLIDRVVMVHRELHHADDAAEIGDEPAEHASFVHAPERDFRRVARREGLEKKAVRLLVLAQAGVDALQGLRHQPGRVRVDWQVRSVGDPEQPDEVHRIALEGVIADNVDAIVVDLEILGVRDRAGASAQASDEAAERRRPLGLTVLKRRAYDRGQIADVLGDEEIVLHEPLDVDQPRAGRIAKLTGDRPLNVEAQPLLRPAGEKVEPAAHAPEEFLASAKQRRTLAARTARRRRVRAGCERGRRIWRSKTAC